MSDMNKFSFFTRDYPISTYDFLQCVFFAVVLFLVCSYALLDNDVIYSNVMTHDNFIFIDGIHRVLSGHVAHIDFVTGLGALNFIGPAMLHSDGLTEITLFLRYNVLILFVFLLACVYLVYTRLNLFGGLVLLFYVGAIVAAPSNIGDPGTLVTHAMFYNRFGWAALLLSFIILLPRRRGVFYLIADSLLLALLLVFSFYTKVTYFVALVVILSIAFLLYYSRFKYEILAGVLISSLVVLIVERVVPSFHLNYLMDILDLRAASGGVELNFHSDVRKNSVELFYFVVVLYLMNDIYNDSPYNRIKHLVLLSTMALISIFIVSNNAQYSGLPSLFAVYLAAFMLYVKNQRKEEWKIFGFVLILIVSSVPEAYARYSSLQRFWAHPNRHVFETELHPALSQVFVREGNVQLLRKIAEQERQLFDLAAFRGVSLHRPIQEIYQTEYIYTVSEGLYLLEETLKTNGIGSVMNMDFSNPFSPLLGLPPIEGEYAWYHDNRNFSRLNYMPDRVLFKYADYVMHPKYPAVLLTNLLAWEVYGDYLRNNFRTVSENNYWIIYKKRAEHKDG